MSDFLYEFETGIHNQKYFISVIYSEDTVLILILIYS